MQITWKIANLIREVSTGIVREARWTITAEQNEIFSTINGQTAFYAEVAAIPYEELTEADVINWIWSILGNDKARLETEIARSLEDKSLTETTTGLPWSTE